ncbi:ribonuclease H-like domain-containing protein, partial [Tanacetum coccineum]
MLTGQDTLSRSIAEAEYHGVANAVAETSWIRNLLRELHTPLFIATLVYCDNVSAVYMSATTTISIFPGEDLPLSPATCRWGKPSPAKCRWGIFTGEVS